MPNRPSYLSLDETTLDPLALETKKSMLIQEAIYAHLHISLEPISLDEQLQRVLELILTLPWWRLERKGCIFLTNETEKVLVMKARVGMTPGVQSTCSRVPFGTCLCGRAIATNKVIFTDCLNAGHTI